MKHLLLAILMLATTTAMAQQNKKYETSKDEKTGNLIFKGPLTFNDLNDEPAFDWAKSGYEEYKPDADKVSYLKKYLPQYSMIVFMGTWCDDSHYLIPKLEKVLHDAGFPMAQYTMYGVDRDKNTVPPVNKEYNITNVPTIIILKNNKETGRITETVKTSMETDLTEILQKDRQH